MVTKACCSLKEANVASKGSPSGVGCRRYYKFMYYFSQVQNAYHPIFSAKLAVFYGAWMVLFLSSVRWKVAEFKQMFYFSNGCIGWLRAGQMLCNTYPNMFHFSTRNQVLSK